MTGFDGRTPREIRLDDTAARRSFLTAGPLVDTAAIQLSAEKREEIECVLFFWLSIAFERRFVRSSFDFRSSHAAAMACPYAVVKLKPPKTRSEKSNISFCFVWILARRCLHDFFGFGCSFFWAKKNNSVRAFRARRVFRHCDGCAATLRV